jgi:hypothetical protein
MVGHCKDCRYFKSDGRGWPYRGWGDCTRLLDGYFPDVDKNGPEGGQLAIPWDGESYSAGLYVSPEFGCVQFDCPNLPLEVNSDEVKGELRP